MDDKQPFTPSAFTLAHSLISDSLFDHSQETVMANTRPKFCQVCQQVFTLICFLRQFQGTRLSEHHISFQLSIWYPQNTFVILKTFFNINNSKPYHRQICLCTQKVNKPRENLQAKKSRNTSIQTFKETHVKHCLLMDNRMVPFSNSAGVPFKVINF